MKRIAKNGAAEFSRRHVEADVDDMPRIGGLITLEDLAQYQPKAREACTPVTTSTDTSGTYSVASPSSGGVAIEKRRI